jgi:hypothetical protein
MCTEQLPPGGYPIEVKYIYIYIYHPNLALPAAVLFNKQCTTKIGITAVPKATESLFVAINISLLRSLYARSDVCLLSA